jgi:hypothetical protein
MSYPMPGPPAPPPQPRARPATVTASSWLLFFVAALYVATFVGIIATMSTVMDIYRDIYAGTDLEGTEGIVAASSVVVGAVWLVIAIGVVVLAVLNNKGKNASRIVTWVLGGLALCCSGALLALEGLLTDMQAPDVDGPDPAAVQRALDAALPDWYNTLGWVTSIGSILALIAALVLLALPASNEFFRAPRQPPYEPPPYPQPPYPQPPTT